MAIPRLKIRPEAGRYNGLIAGKVQVTTQTGCVVARVEYRSTVVQVSNLPSWYRRFLCILHVKNCSQHWLTNRFV